MWEASKLMKHIKIKHHYNHSEGKGGVNVRYKEQIIINRNKDKNMRTYCTDYRKVLRGQ